MALGYFGKYSGIVKSNADDKKLGRLKVTVPSLFPADEQMLARPALPYGVFFVPENDMHVWVEFEGGDSTLPLWTGVQVIEGSPWADEADADPPTKRVLRTKAHHRIEFNDKDGDEAILIVDGKNGHSIELTADGIAVKDGKNSHAVTLDAQGVVVTDGKNSHSVELKSAGATVKAASGAKVELTSSGAKVSAPGGAKVDLTASGATVDGGAGMVEVKGSLIKLSSSAAMPIARVGDMGVGNLGAPVTIIPPGNLTVLA
jgi:hypothetical protein